MSDSHRLKTLETLELKGVYVNDYPGLILDGKDLSYFYLRFSREDLFGPEGEARSPARQAGESLLTGGLKFIDNYNGENPAADSDRELKIFYLDDQGYCILGLVEDDKKPLRFKTRKRELEAERLFQVNLYRIYSAEGLDGRYRIQQGEVKAVNDGLQKFIATYILGWMGLFRQYETIGERTEVFRRFKPFKFPIFGTKESLKKAVFHIQLGARTPDGDEGFKRVSTGCGTIKLEDALAG